MTKRFSLSSTIFTLSLALLPATITHAQEHSHMHMPKKSTITAENNKPVAYVNDTAIMTADIESEMEELPEMFTAGRDDEVRQAIIERLVQKRLILEEAKKLGLENDPDYLSQLETLKENLMFNFVISKKLEEEITPARVKKYYDQHGKDYAFNSVKAGHILLKTEDEAKDIIKKLDKGEDFTQLALTFSTGPAAVNGGMLGWLAQNTMVEPFENAVFSMKPGEYSKTPVKTQFGYHVIKVFDKDENHIPSYDELEPEIQEKLGEEVVTDYLKSLQEKAKIRYEEATK